MVRQALVASAQAFIAKEIEVAGKDPEFSPGVMELKKQLSAIDSQEAEAALRNSIAGRFGTALEGITKLAGFDWRTNIALVGGFAAKQVVVSTLGTAYSIGKVDI